jgi:hypothetical protein
MTFVWIGLYIVLGLVVALATTAWVSPNYNIKVYEGIILVALWPLMLFFILIMKLLYNK